ncbi:MAG: hypothetical protein AAB426_05980 [Myxococcota bacterium]
MSRVDGSREAVWARLREASAISDLAAGRRLDGKLDLTPAGVTARLHEAFELYELCRSLRALPRHESDTDESCSAEKR